MSILRDGLLQGRVIVLAGEALEDSLAGALRDLGSTVTPFAPEIDDQGEGGAEWVTAHGAIDALVYDAAPAFAHGGPEALSATLNDVWTATAAVASGAFIPAGRGKIVLIAPPADAGPYAQAAQAGLENLARTLSVEWARHAITVSTIAPATSEHDLTTLVAFLVSSAGDYYSGCRLDVR
jgi:NAD(P)-dependent dehydrogenase (short-subunit alcohol dehydrogenase family)